MPPTFDESSRIMARVAEAPLLPLGDQLFQRLLRERIAQHTGQALDQIERDSDRDRWFTADEAKDYGFVDHVVQSATQVPSEGPVS